MWTDPSFSGLSPDLDIKIAARSRCHGGDFPHAIVEFRCPRADMRCRLLAPIVRQLLFRQADRLSLCNAWMTRRLNTRTPVSNTAPRSYACLPQTALNK